MFLSTWIIQNDHLNNPIYNLKIIICIIIFTIILSKMHKTKPSTKVYLVDFACFKPKESQQLTREATMERIIQHIRQTNFTEESLQILWKMVKASGIGDATYAPEPLLRDTPDFSLAAARQEAEASIFGVVEMLLGVSGLKVDDIGVLVVNCSVSNPVPSFASMIVNRFKLRDDVKGYCLSGMGCSASLIAINLASQVLQVHPNTCAMVVSTEIICPNCYTGNDPQKLSINAIMRVGAAAIILSNRPSDRHSSKYQLIHSIRTNTTNLDQSYGCIFHEEDPQGHVGINLTKDLLVVARKTAKCHLLSLGSLILPISERLKFTTNYLARKLVVNLKPYSPNFGRAVNHFFPHVGLKPVLDVMEKTLMVNIEAARMTLYRFGNTSSSSIWYELAYAEAKGQVKRGDRVWQMSFGSGFKCNSLIWKALKDVEGQEEHNPWSQEIDNFPVQPKVIQSSPFGFLQPK